MTALVTNVFVIYGDINNMQTSSGAMKQVEPLDKYTDIHGAWLALTEASRTLSGDKIVASGPHGFFPSSSRAAETASSNSL